MHKMQVIHQTDEARERDAPIPMRSGSKFMFYYHTSAEVY